MSSWFLPDLTFFHVEMSVFINENYRAGFLLTAVVVCLETCEGRGLESGSKWICGIFSS